MHEPITNKCSELAREGEANAHEEGPANPGLLAEESLNRELPLNHMVGVYNLPRS